MIGSLSVSTSSLLPSVSAGWGCTTADETLADADSGVCNPVELRVVRVLHGLDLLAVLEDEVLLLVLTRDACVVERDDLKAVVEDGRAARPLRRVALVPDHVRVFVGHALVLAYGELAARAAGVLDDGHPLFEKNLAAVCDEAVVAEGRERHALVNRLRLDGDEREVERLVVEEEEVGPQSEAVGGFGPTGHVEAVVELGDGGRGLVRRAEHVFVREQKPQRDHEARGAPALVARRGADAYAADGACREQRAFEVELVNE